ncbi:MAG: HAD family hydrolase [Oscillospiraceae bacterium]|nr:HAD family hydrolase [Oscillospiraceae bacterium]
MVSHVLFDLDGTLTESGIGITRSVMYALRQFGITERDPETLARFIGPPLVDSFHKYYGFPMEQAELAVKYYREYYSVTGIFENRVYDGVREMLSALNERGVGCVLATSKPEHYAVKILDHFDLSSYFTAVCGATMDTSRSKKADVIAYALKTVGADPARTVMVGDRDQDILGAKTFGLSAVGVLYGYGSREELLSAGADALAESALDILRFC